MANALPNHAWADSMADWGFDNADALKEHAALTAEEKAILSADYTPADRHEGVLYTAPQGRVSQGWPVRRCTPEMACYDTTQDDQPAEALTPAEAFLLSVIYCLSAIFVTWLLVTLAKAWS